MSKPEHFAKIREGVKAWNEWRKRNPTIEPDLSGTDLRGAYLSLGYFNETDFSGAILSEANLGGANLSEANISGADLSGAYLNDADLIATDLSGANLSMAYLSGAMLSKASLIEADLRRAILVRALLREADLSRAELIGADLRGANLSMGNLSGANLSGADLSTANLSDVNLREANLSGADLHDADLRKAYLRGATLVGADLRGANLDLAFLIETVLDDADLTGCHVYGTSVWNASVDRAIQSNLIITREEEPAIQVDSLEVAQFIYLLLSNAKIRDVIDTIGKKAVLILGRFTPQRKAVLDNIREALRYSGFLPILFDFAKPNARDTHETIVTLAGLSRFIIADISEPRSIPQELGSIVPMFPSVPVQPLLQIGYEPWGMYDHIKRYPWVLPLVEYENQEALTKDLELKVIQPAEAKAREQTRK